MAIALALAGGAVAQENYESWRLHVSKFPSTGGGGIIIGEYNPVIVGDKCKTDFTATEPNGTVYYNSVEFDAVPAQGGIAVHQWPLALARRQRDRNHALPGVLQGRRGARLALSRVTRSPKERRNAGATAPQRRRAGRCSVAA